MKRTWPVWMMFVLFLAVGLVAMGWISMTVLRLDRAEADAHRQAVLEENVRLALWRMDSMLSPLIAQEIARPYFAYSAFTPAERAYTKMFNEITYGEVLVPSPLLVHESPVIDLHFQFQPDGSLSSPQVPTGNMRDLAGRHTTREHINAAAAKLDRLQSIVRRDTLMASLPAERAEATPAMPLQLVPQNDLRVRQQLPAAPQQQQAMKSATEYQARDINTARVSNYELRSNRAKTQNAVLPNRIREGVMRPLWIDSTLLLARRVSINDEDFIQGCWLNWPTIRSMLLDDIRDLLPEAQLQPVMSKEQDRQPRRLASLPVKLIAGPATAGLAEPVSPIRFTLLVAWVGVIVASAAVGALLAGAITLSHRRGEFVSAVTHELRTPLTTVSMYAEMLEEGMISDETKRRKYLGTLRAEANRLGHLVENVLAYSRIERGAVNGRIQTVALPRLIDDIKDRLTTRIEQANMQLCLQISASCADRSVRADASAVEQILLNLVDNAGKYARGATDRRLHMDIECDGHAASIRVRDHGPGIAHADATRLFRPFSKSARDAANSAPGVGLGLALSRRLAREMRGDLRLDPAVNDGASFVLTLPLAQS